MSLQYVTRKLKTQSLGSSSEEANANNAAAAATESDMEDYAGGADDEEDVVVVNQVGYYIHQLWRKSAKIFFSFSFFSLFSFFLSSSFSS